MFGESSSPLSSYLRLHSTVADALSRILAHAGFDPRHALRFWENRHDTPETAECSPGRAEEAAAPQWQLTRRLMGDTHPVHQVRVQKLKAELDRWEEERRAARARREAERAAQREAEVAPAALEGV
ncbi:hypothetical protein NUW54_g10154 [Trametes sanguinea]|uniref:Uncharacterized protein n=1 Tax=Trametes sanguinea TaxID=158606 RepID=A0ACC1P1N0_9APHY|nr:hypothetical protein NUW54_g10154 [Trametes sanguinea]